jgi:ABC-type phosphate transport system substrate-binding protein
MARHFIRSAMLRGAATIAAIAWTTQADAAPSTQLIGGGANSPEIVYRNLMNCYGNQGGPGGNNPGDFAAGLPASPQANCNVAAPPTFNYNSAVAIFYVGVGSGNGKKAFLNYNNSDFTGDTNGTPQCTPGATTFPPRVPDSIPVNGISVPVPGTAGIYWGGPPVTGTGAGWTPDTTGAFPTNASGACNVSFATSDDPLTPVDMGVYGIGGASTSAEHPTVDFHSLYGEVIQFPMAVEAIAIPFNPTGTFNRSGAAVGGNPLSHFNLRIANLCQIMNGTITHWNDPAFTADNGGNLLDTSPDRILVVIRSDGSRSTFFHSDALITQCATAGVPLNVAYFAGANSAGANNNFWLNAQAAMIADGVNVVAVAGSGGVKATINANPGSIGYVPNNFVHLGGANYDATGPLAANLQSAASIGGAPVFRAPTAANAFFIMGATLPPASSVGAPCPVAATYAAGTSPDGVCAHNPVNWSARVPAPTSPAAYAIGGFTYGLAYTCYATPGDLAAMFSNGVTKGYFPWHLRFPPVDPRVNPGLMNFGFARIPNVWINGNATQEGLHGPAAHGLLISDPATIPAVAGTPLTACAAVGPGA